MPCRADLGHLAGGHVIAPPVWGLEPSGGARGDSAIQPPMAVAESTGQRPTGRRPEDPRDKRERERERGRAKERKRERETECARERAVHDTTIAHGLRLKRHRRRPCLPPQPPALLTWTRRSRML